MNSEEHPNPMARSVSVPPSDAPQMSSGKDVNIPAIHHAPSNPDDRRKVDAAHQNSGVSLLPIWKPYRWR